MLVIKIEMWPHGDSERARSLGVATIANTGRGTRDVADYDVRLFKAPEYSRQAETRPLHQMLLHPLAKETWKKGRVEGFPRLSLGPWDLLFRALGALVTKRSPRVSTDGEIELRDEAAALAERDRIIDALHALLREARSTLDTLNANTQGQDQANVRDPLTDAVCQDLIDRIGTVLDDHVKEERP